MPALISTFLSTMPGRFDAAAEQSIVSAQQEARESSRAPEDWRVYIETAPGRNRYQLAPEEIDWESITVGLDAAGSKATLVVRALDASKLNSPGKLGTAHLKHLLEKVGINQRVKIAQGRGVNQLYSLFCGYPVVGSATWSPNHQAITWTLVSEGDELARTSQPGIMIGRIMRKFPDRDPEEFDDGVNFDLIEVDALPPVFNAGGKPNMLDQLLDIPNTVGMKVFSSDGAPGAKMWHYANALRYVARFYMSYADIDVGPLLRDTKDFVGLAAGSNGPHPTDPLNRILIAPVEGVSIASMNCFDAIAALCKKAGLHFEIAHRTGTIGNINPYYLRVFAPVTGPVDDRLTRSRHMIAPQSRDIPRDPPFRNYTSFAPADVAARNAAQVAHLAADVRVVNTPVVVGGARDFECTLLLRYGWKPHKKLDNMRDLNFDPAPPGEGLPLDRKAFAALDFWVAEFGDEEENRDDNGVPVSKFHTQHPDHHEVADVGRLWVFPDTAEYMKTIDGVIDMRKSDYMRTDGPLSIRRGNLLPGWVYYNPYGTDEEMQRLVYSEGMIGGGLPYEELVRNWVQRRRPFGNLIARPNLIATDRAPIVEMNFKDLDWLAAMELDNPNWIPYTGSVVIDPDRAAIWIKEDNLLLSPKLNFENEDGRSFSYIESLIGIDSETGRYVDPHLLVRITCTVRGDQRLQVRPTRTQRTLFRERSSVIDLGFDQYVERNMIEGNSKHQFVAESDPNYSHRNDLAALEAAAREKQAELDRLTVAGDWETNYIETGVRLGDSFRGMEGMGIPFGQWPTCTTIEWIKDPNSGYRTKYHLSDLRHAPDVGAEG